ncbi:MAG TPA: hypothetical protein VE291_07690, partial [Terracidiphilus sp.]|nr:hypothetical protein [Terracidiphilus sp.]
MWTGVSALAVFALLTAAAVVLARRAEPYLRAQIVQSLADHLHARVELDTFHVGLAAGLNGGWGVVAQGRGLRIWPAHSTPSAPSAAAVPLIQVDEFNFHAPLRYQAGQPIVISLVRLNGLTIHIPPHSERLQAGVAAPPVQQRFGASALLARVVFDRIECDHAELVIETDKPGKLPLGFAIEKLHLTRIAASAPMNFEAQLTNPKPVGVIHATGSFGPWQADDPAASPVAGTYTFDHADLATFNGIAGILASTGRFSGTLRQIDTEGDADVPNFSLDRFASPEPLHTHFVARVDGTDGDTWLDSVNATLGSAHFITSGRIVRFKTALAAAGLPPASPESTPASTPASLFEGGHDIFLDIDIEHQP